MTRTFPARLVAAALAVSGLALGACSDDVAVPASSLSTPPADNDVFTVVTAENDSAVQLANLELASGTLTPVTRFAQTESDDHTAALQRLVGANDLSQPPSGGLISSAGLALQDSDLAQLANLQAQADASAVSGATLIDCTYVQVEKDRHTALLAQLQAWHTQGVTDGGANVQNQALIDELGAEITTVQDHLNKASLLFSGLNGPGGKCTSSSDSTGG